MTKDNPEFQFRHSTGLSRLREWFRNPISLVGLVLAVIALGNFFFLFFLDLSSDHRNPYVGILAYMLTGWKKDPEYISVSPRSET